MKKLKDLLTYRQPTEYIVQSEQYNDSYPVPVLTAGKSFVLGKTNDKTGIFDATKSPIILFDDFTTATQWVDFPFKVKSSACKILEPKNGVNIRYVYYAMKHINFDASQHMRYWISKYSNCAINYPSEDKQNHVVSVLDLIKKKISLCEKDISTLDELIKSRFIEMFGDPIYNTKNFSKKELAKLVPFNTLKTKADKNKKSWLLNLDMVEANTGNILGKIRTPKLDGSIIRFDTNCVLYSKLRPYLNKVVIPDEDGYCTSELVSMKCDPKIITREYLTFALRSSSFVTFADSKTAGAKMPRLNMNVLRNFKLPIPPIARQNEFAFFVEQVDKLKFNAQKRIDLYQELLNKKMDEYFN